MSRSARVAQLAEAIGSNPMQCGFESRSGHAGTARTMSLMDAIRRWRRDRRERAREDAERKAQAQGKLNDEVIAEGRRATENPPAPGELSRWEQ